MHWKKGIFLRYGILKKKKASWECPRALGSMIHMSSMSKVYLKIVCGCNTMQRTKKWTWPGGRGNGTARAGTRTAQTGLFQERYNFGK